jgi:dihydrolipoamide dehydrogenase
MKYDVTVIGSGPGGYVAAIRCAQLGMKVAIVERYNTLGGTCTNVGCIPSKALLDSSELYWNAKNHFGVHGIAASELAVNWQEMVNRKVKVVQANTAGLSFLMKKNKIDVHHGHGRFLSAKKISVLKPDGSKAELETEKTIIATGSKPAGIAGVNMDKKRIITSTEALSLNEIPQTLLVIGGGVIGCEMASVFARLGSKVTVVEYFNTLLTGMDKEAAKELQKCLSRLDIEFFLSHQVSSATASENDVVVKAVSEKNEPVEWIAQYCLVAVGRQPYTENLGLDSIGIETDKGKIPVNQNLETSVPGIYAIGDVIKGAMLAHKAEEEGTFVAEIMAGQKPHIRYSCIPNVVYTWPEVAAVGATEEELKEKQIAYNKGVFPFRASGRARAAGEADGFVKVLTEKNSDEILGVHIIGPRAADLIAEAVAAMEFRASAEDIARISHAHPTYSEAMKEACLMATANRAIHL